MHAKVAMAITIPKTHIQEVSKLHSIDLRSEINNDSKNLHWFLFSSSLNLAGVVD